MKHYVYRITNKKTKKYYYGVRTTNIEPKEDIGYIYFSSSHDKEFMKDQKENQESYKYKVVYIFSTRKKALELEIKLHNKFNVGVNESFYNRAKQSSVGFDRTGSIFTKEHREKLSSWQKGKKLSEEHKNKLKKAKENISEETKSKMSLAQKGKKHSDERKMKISLSNTGQIRSIESRKKISDGKKGKEQKKVKCNYCGKEGGISNMKRYHFHNCKNKK